MNPDGLAPVPVVPVGGIAATTTLWRWRDSCHVSVAGKATFAMQHRAVMSPISVEPLEDHEVVPYRPATDVVLVAAHAFSDEPTEATAVRLVMGGRQATIDKSLLVYAPRPGGVVAPFQQAAIIKRTGRPQALVVDPNRPNERGTFGKVEMAVPTLGDGGEGVTELDDEVDWASFHAAPEDQRLKGVRGDEWLVLEGMTAGRRRFESRLPAALVETRIYSPDLWCGRSLLVTMEPCVISVDADNLQCSIVWRGSFTVESVESARALVLVSALHRPSMMTSWPTASQVSASVALVAHRARAAGYADTAQRSEPAAPAAKESLQARVAKRIESLGPLATMPIEPSTSPLEDASTDTVNANDPKMVVLRDDKVGLRPYDPHAMSVTDTGTLDLPPDRSELAAPRSKAVSLQPLEGAPWSRRSLANLQDAARRAAGGTIIADDDLPPEIDDQDVDTLEQTLTDSLDEAGGDPIAQFLEVSDD